MNSSDLILCLQSMAPELHLTQEEARHIYEHECGSDFQKSMDYLLRRRRTQLQTKHKHKHKHKTTTETETKTDTNKPQSKCNTSNNNTNTNTNTNNEDQQPTIDYLKKMSHEDVELLDRLGGVLLAFSRRELNMLAFSQKELPALLEDYLEILRKLQSCELAPHLVEGYLHSKYLQCSYDGCECLAVNTRDRMKPNQKPQANASHHHSANNENERVKQLRSTRLLLSVLHSSLLHVTDCGYALTRDEEDRLAQEEMKGQVEEEGNDEEVEDEMQGEEEDGDEPDWAQLLHDKRSKLVRQMLAGRRRKYEDGRHDQTQAGGSKFVTVAPGAEKNVNENQNSNSNSNSESDSKNNSNNENASSGGSKSKIPSYSFGVKMYYWPKYKNRERRDPNYNGGRYMYCEWYIERKYDSLKQELTQNQIKPIPVEAWQDEHDKVMVWMNTKYVKKMKCQYGWSGHDYNIAPKTSIRVEHVQSLSCYTNMTELSTRFSSVFRRVPDSESDESLKRRNAEFRELGRSLVECVHVFGTIMRGVPHSVVYHGVSIQMKLGSLFAVFCSPTSTTPSAQVALNFADRGIVIGIQNNNSRRLSCFNCVLSDYSNENEYLFINGGHTQEYSTLNYIALAFVSIRSIEFALNYEPFVTAFSALQQIIAGYNALQNQTRHGRANARQLRSLISNCIGGRDLDSLSPRSLAYIQSMFNDYTQRHTKIQIFLPVLNCKKNNSYYCEKNPLFLVYRSLFCELYPEEVVRKNEPQWKIKKIKYHEYHRTGYVNRVRLLRVSYLLDLFPNLVHFEMLNLPITHAVMQQIVDVLHTQRKQHKYQALARIFAGEACGDCGVGESNYNKNGRVIQGVPDLHYARAQNDFSTYRECADEYRQQVENLEWKLQVVEVQRTGYYNSSSQAAHVSGLEFVSNKASFDDGRAWKQFHVFHN